MASAVIFNSPNFRTTSMAFRSGIKGKLFNKVHEILQNDYSIQFSLIRSNEFRLNFDEKAAFYIGRTINFPITLIRAIIDIVLQIIQCIYATITYIALALERKLRSKITLQDVQHNKCIIYNFLIKYSINHLLMRLRKLTYNAPTLLAQQLHIIPDNRQISSFNVAYGYFLHKYLV